MMLKMFNIDRGRPALSVLMFLSPWRLQIPFCVLDRMFYITIQIFHRYRFKIGVFAPTGSVWP